MRRLAHQSGALFGFALLTTLLPAEFGLADDEERPLTLSATARAGFEEFRKLNAPGHFAVSEDGFFYGWSYCKEGFGSCLRHSSRRIAISSCQRASDGTKCFIFADESRIVWKGPITVRGGGVLPELERDFAEETDRPLSLSALVADAFERYKEMEGSGSFAVSEDGNAFGAAFCEEGARDCPKQSARIRALNLCNRYSEGKKCYVYAFEHRVVWKGRVELRNPDSNDERGPESRSNRGPRWPDFAVVRMQVAALFEKAKIGEPISSNCQEKFNRHLRQDNPAFFFVNPQNGSCGFTRNTEGGFSDQLNSARRAKRDCEKAGGSRCRLYAVSTAVLANRVTTPSLQDKHADILEVHAPASAELVLHGDCVGRFKDYLGQHRPGFFFAGDNGFGCGSVSKVAGSAEAQLSAAKRAKAECKSVTSKNCVLIAVGQDVFARRALDRLD